MAFFVEFVISFRIIIGVIAGVDVLSFDAVVIMVVLFRSVGS